ncbi:hypothetical protein COC46_07450 [Bacillus sp. AFS041924]|nr:hypothetical protein COC46_07450 [Bacillus sp. AFS041924]
MLVEVDPVKTTIRVRNGNQDFDFSKLLTSKMQKMLLYNQYLDSFLEGYGTFNSTSIRVTRVAFFIYQYFLCVIHVNNFLNHTFFKKEKNT